MTATQRVDIQGNGSASPGSALLARLLHYGSAVITAPNSAEAAQLIVRRISELLPSQRALLVQTAPKFKIVTTSAGHNELRNGSLLSQLKKFSKRHKGPALQTYSQTATQTAKQAEKQATDQTAGNSSDQILWLPIEVANHREKYALWLQRGTPWLEAEQTLINRLLPFLRSGLFQHNPKKTLVAGKAVKWLAAFVIVTIVIAWPVRQSAVATAEVIAAKPHYIYSPLSGVVDKVLVAPGDAVVVGQELLRLDSQLLEQRVTEAREDVAVELAELNRLESAGFADNQARAALPVQRLKINKAKAALEFQQTQLNRSYVVAPAAGVVIMPDAASLEGAAVQLGEQLLSIADPATTELLLQVPVKDRGIFRQGAEVQLRLDSNPLNVIAATATRANYDVSSNSSEQPVVDVRARWNDTTPTALLGQRGSARIYGDQSHFGWQLIRKPLLATLDIFGY